MYQSTGVNKILVILLLAISWTDASAREEKMHSGAACKHSFQGTDSLDTNVQYGSFGGISNHSKTKTLSVTCPVVNLEHEDRSNSVVIFFKKNPNANKDSAFSCTLTERSDEGQFIQSFTNSPDDTNQERKYFSVGLSDARVTSTLVMECRIPTHGSRILSYRVRNNAGY